MKIDPENVWKKKRLCALQAITGMTDMVEEYQQVQTLEGMDSSVE